MSKRVIFRFSSFVASFAIEESRIDIDFSYLDRFTMYNFS